jgi:fibronectin-binding autotransporter adhesin
MRPQRHPTDAALEALFLAYWDHALTDDQAAELTRRLATDPQVRKEFEAYCLTAVIAADLAAAEPTPEPEAEQSHVRGRLATLIAGLVGAILLSAPSARADEYSWKAPVNGNWNVGTNWNVGGSVANSPPAAGDNATISTAGAYTVTLSDNQAITNLMLNNGTATLSQTAGTLTLGGTLALTAGIYSLNGGTSPGGSISGGSITSTGGQLRLQNNTANVLNNVHIGAGVLDFSAPGAQVRLQGTTTLAAGTVVDLTGGTSILSFQQTTTTTGLAINLSSSGGSFLSVDGNNTLTLDSTSSITCSVATGASGQIRSGLLAGGTTALVNQGLIRNTGTAFLNINCGIFTNSAGGIVRVENGTIALNPGTNFTNFAGTTLTGGTWEVRGTAILDSGNRPFATLAAGTTVILNGPNPTWADLNALTTNNGTLRVLGGKTYTPTAASVSNAGVLEVGTGSTFAKSINLQTGGRLEGVGTVSAVTVGGTIAPGNTTAPVGTLTTGGQTWAGGGTYEISYGKNHGSLTAGADNDYLTSPSGALAVTATPGSKFTLRMSYTGPAVGPDPELTIKVGTFGGGVPATFDPSAFQLVGDIPLSGSVFQLTSVGNDVFLTFTPVPEPGSVLLVGAAGSGVCVVVRRLRRRVAMPAG